MITSDKVYELVVRLNRFNGMDLRVVPVQSTFQTLYHIFDRAKCLFNKPITVTAAYWFLQGLLYSKE